MTKKTQKGHPPSRGKGIPTRWFILGGIAAVAVLLLAFTWFSLTPKHAYSGTPRLAVNTERLDLGKQILGTTVHASFEVKNAGTGTLTLRVPPIATLLDGC